MTRPVLVDVEVVDGKPKNGTDIAEEAGGSGGEVWMLKTPEDCRFSRPSSGPASTPLVDSSSIVTASLRHDCLPANLSRAISATQLPVGLPS